MRAVTISITRRVLSGEILLVNYVALTRRCLQQMMLRVNAAVENGDADAASVKGGIVDERAGWRP